MERYRFKLLLVAIPLWLHCHKFYVISDEWLSALHPNLSSFTFLLASAILAIEKLKLPEMPNCWPKTFLYFYKITAMIFLPSIALRIIWLPLTYCMAVVHRDTAIWLDARKTNLIFVKYLIAVLRCPAFLAIEQLSLALYVFHAVATATGLIEWFKCRQQLPPRDVDENQDNEESE